MKVLIGDIRSALATTATEDLSGVGALTAEIASLESDKATLSTDAETAKLRKDLLKERDVAITRHALFFMDKPMRRNTIPIMWAISVAFIAVGVLVFKNMIPIQITGTGAGTDLSYGSASFLDSIMAFIYDPRVWMGITAAAVVVIIFLVLKILGVFGGEKRPKQVVE